MLLRKIAVFLAATMLLMLSGVTISAQTEDYATFYVSQYGDDNNPGTQSQPFATIEKAKSKVREISSQMTSDITVYIMDGQYFLNNTLQFTNADSGKNGYNVIYKAFPGATPVINGGQVITGWTLDSGNIYKANVGSGKNFSVLIENGELCTLARYPNTGYNTMVSNNNSLNSFKFNTGDIPNIASINDLQVYLWAGGTAGDINWWPDLIGVKSIDYSSRVVTLKSNASRELGTGSRYFVQGAKELLDSPGEFYLDKGNGILYYYPRKTPIEAQNIVAPNLGNIIEISGSSRTDPVHNITFEGLSITNADYKNNAFNIMNADYITIKDCKINNIGGDAIYIGERAQNNTIYGNYIYDIGMSGISVSGPNDGYVNKNNIIKNNYIRNVGLFDGGSAGIGLWQTGGNTVSHNKVSDTPRYSISMSSPMLSSSIGQTLNGITITSSNIQQVKRDALNLKDNIIEFNDLSNANTDSQDSGVFYTWGSSAGGNIVRNNELHDSDMSFSFGYGLYLDDCADNFEVYNNIIDNLQKGGKAGYLAGAMMVKGIGNKIYNNIIVDNNTGSVQDSGVHSSVVVQQLNVNQPTSSNDIQKNIVAFNTHPNIYRFLNGGTTPDVMLAVSDYNLFYNPSNIYRVQGVPGSDPTDLSGWRKAYGGKYDNNSVTADPLFMDMAGRDYRVKYTSPAYNLGFKDFDMENIGLMSDFKYGNPEESLNKVFIRNSEDTVNKSLLKMKRGDSAILKVLGRTTSGFVANLQNAQITYSSSDNTVAVVNQSGEVTGKGAGNAQITVSVTKNGITKTAIMDVAVENADSSGIIQDIRTANGVTVQDEGFVTAGTTSLVINFRDSVNQATINSNNISITKNGIPLDCVITPSDKSCTIDLSSPIESGASYRLLIKKDIQLANGQGLSADVPIVFKGCDVGINVDSVNITDNNNQPVSALQPSSLTFASAKIINNQQASQNVALIAAIYDSKGVLRQMSYAEKDFKANESSTLGVAVTTPANVRGSVLKVFLWDGISSVRPIYPNTELR